MLEIRNLSIRVNGKEICNNFSAYLNATDKLAIIGEEGNGKSTLLKVLLGECDYAEVSGSIQSAPYTFGYLKQSYEEEKEIRVEEFLFGKEEKDYALYASFYQYLDTFGFSEEILQREFETLSGGEKVKVAILRLLLQKADILLLDEPTNDLDLETLLWLEDFILNYNKLVIFVSHDETLLSHCANCILHIEQIRKKSVCRTTFERVGYDTYTSKRSLALEKQDMMAKSERREYKEKRERLNRIMQKVEHQQRTISRGDPHGGFLLKKHMRNLKAQERKLDETQLTEKVDVEEGISFRFEENALPKGKTVLELDLDTLCVEGKALSKEIHVKVYGQDKICIIGRNGIGKSTLIKKMYELLQGRDEIKLGYMPQNYEDQMDYDATVLEYLAPSAKKEDVTKARLYLGNMKFTREEMVRKIRDLSNGSRAKLYLLKFVLDGVNVLLLDEPTRNVSPLSNPKIRYVLSEFTGCIIAVSHDRRFIEEVPSMVYEMTPDGLFPLQ